MCIGWGGSRARRGTRSWLVVGGSWPGIRRSLRMVRRDRHCGLLLVFCAWGAVGALCDRRSDEHGDLLAARAGHQFRRRGGAVALLVPADGCGVLSADLRRVWDESAAVPAGGAGAADVEHFP